MLRRKRGANVLIKEKVEGLPKKELLRPDEVAKYFSVTKRTVYKWCECGQLDHIRVGRTLRVVRSSVVNK